MTVHVVSLPIPPKCIPDPLPVEGFHLVMPFCSFLGFSSVNIGYNMA